MIELKPTPGPIHEFSLAERSKRSSGDLSSLEGKVALTEPVVLTLDKGLIGEDSQLLAEYNQLAKTHCHYFVSFNCSFAPQGNERFEYAEISIKMDTKDAPSPVVHSMRPNQLIDTAKLKSSAILGAGFVIEPEIGAEQEVEKKEMFLRTFLSGSKAYWLFQRTKASEIEGAYPLQFVVRSPSSYANITGNINLSIKMGDKRFWMFWQDEKVSEPATMPFSGGGSHD
jgi:hypothetical protein